MSDSIRRWGLIVEQNTGSGSELTWFVSVLGHADGTREDALAALRQRIAQFHAPHPHKIRSRALYQVTDGFLLVLDGRMRAYHYRFTIAGQLPDAPPA
jgi:hypothetical protein